MLSRRAGILVKIAPGGILLGPPIPVSRKSAIAFKSDATGILDGQELGGVCRIPPRNSTQLNSSISRRAAGIFFLRMAYADAVDSQIAQPRRGSRPLLRKIRLNSASGRGKADFCRNSLDSPQENFGRSQRKRGQDIPRKGTRRIR